MDDAKINKFEWNNYVMRVEIEKFPFINENDKDTWS